MPMRSPVGEMLGAGTERLHVPTTWCPGDQGQLRVGKVAVDHVQISAADATGMHGHEHLPGAGLGIG